MAGFKTQIKARFKAKFPKVNLSAAKLDAIIARVDAKTEADDDEAIDASLDAINEFTPFEEMAREEDKIRSLEAKTKPKVETTEVEKPETKTDDVPAWAKGLTDTIQTLSSKLTALEGEKTTTTRKQQLAEKLKDAPESYKNTVLKAFGRMAFDTDEAFDEYLTEAEADATAFIQEQSNSGLGNDRPSNGLNGGGNTGKASEAELDAALANFKI